MTDTANPSTPATERGPVADEAVAYASTWLVDEDLESLNRRIHDGVPDEGLMDRARGYRDWVFETYPSAQPGPSDNVMELGSGVGWIMEAVLERFPVREIVGLDISANMIKRAQERFSNPKARFVLYDGFTMPFEDGHFNTIYSVAAMQHIEKHVAFLLFEELHRVLHVGGHAMIHLLGVTQIPESVPNYHDECWNHVNRAPVHWHHYYSFDELFILFSDVIGVTDLDISVHGNSFLIHFSKGTDQRYLRPDLPSLLLAERLKARDQPNEPPPPTTLQLIRSFAGQVRRDARALRVDLRSKSR